MEQNMTTKDKESEVKGLFDEADVIYAYTRADALEDGVLKDVSKMAREAGFRYPVAVTCGVWAEYVRVPEGVGGQSESGRLWDILWMTRCAAMRSLDRGEIKVDLFVCNQDAMGPKLVTLKALVHPGDQHEPVITIMMPHED
jgi:hypothetical protein